MKKLWSMLLALNLAAILAVAGGAGAATYYVDASKGRDNNKGTSINSPWKSLSKINASSFLPADTILFKRGQTWTGRLTIRSSGSVNMPITLRDYGTGNKPIINGNDSFCAILLDKSSFIIIKNMQVINSKGQGLVIKASQTNGLITIDYCDIHNNMMNGISVEDRGDTIIKNCNLYSNGWSGMSVNYEIDTGSLSDIKGDNMKLTNNIIYNNSKHGVYLAGNNAVIQHNTFYANGIDNGYTHNLYLIGDNSLVESNIIRDAKGSGFRYKGSNMVFRYNFLKANHEHNILFWNNFPTVMSNNKIYYNIIIVNRVPVYENSMAIFVCKSDGAGDFDGIEIYNNSIYAANDAAGGVWFKYCDNIDIRNNIIKTGNGYLFFKASPEINVKSDHNVLNSTKNLPIYSGVDDVALGDWQDLGYEDNSYFTDPLFVSSAPAKDTDFALSAISCAKHAGIDLSLVEDYLGNPIYGEPDMGALQSK